MHSLYYERATSFGRIKPTAMPHPSLEFARTAILPGEAPGAAPSTIDDQDRYSRQILFAGIGPQGQRELSHAHVAVVGCGATGAAAASLLARAGVGTLSLIDRDFVE